MSDSSAISIRNLVFRYPRASHSFKIAEWSLEKEAKVFLYGASGSGKSTLLNLISGILTPESGEVSLLSQPFSELSAGKRDRFRAQHIGVVFQEFNLIPYLTVMENIQLATRFAKSQQLASILQENVDNIFSRLNISPSLLIQRADTLSVGQRQRVSIARALINQPEILIADEPTSALDSANRDEFMHLLMETAEASKCTVLFVSHDESLKTHFSISTSIQELVDLS